MGEAALLLAAAGKGAMVTRSNPAPLRTPFLRLLPAQLPSQPLLLIIIFLDPQTAMHLFF